MSTLNELIQKIKEMNIPRPSSGIQVSHQENDHPLHCRCAKCKSNHDEGASNVEPVKSIFISPKAIREKTLPNQESYRNLAEYVEAMRKINAQNPNALHAIVEEQKSDPNGHPTRFVVNHRAIQQEKVQKIINAMQKPNLSLPPWEKPPILTFTPKETERNVVQTVLKKTPSEQHAAVYGFNRHGRKLGGTRRKQSKQRKQRTQRKQRKTRHRK